MRVPPRVMPALVTPFDGTRELDEAAHRHNLGTLTEHGVEGFVIAGSTGEGPYLDDDERGRLLGWAREECGPDPFLVCGIAAESRRTTLRQLEEATEAGADVGLVMTPTTLIRGDHAALAAHYTTLADSADLPLMIYSVPRFTSYEPPVEMVAELAAHPRIVGMKDSGADVLRISRIAASVPADFVLFSGSTAILQLAIVAGAYGAVTSSANYLPHHVLRVVENAASDPEEAGRWQRPLAAVAGLVEQHRVPGVKAAAELAGLRPGLARPPLLAVSPETKQDIATILIPLLEAGATIPRI